jgi:ABC-type polysaccharide/polyol phosphate export permease
MQALMIFTVLAFVVVVGAVIVWALFEMSPFAHHVDQFRDPVTGRKRGESPHLE